MHEYVACSSASDGSSPPRRVSSADEAARPTRVDAPGAIAERACAPVAAAITQTTVAAVTRRIDKKREKRDPRGLIAIFVSRLFFTGKVFISTPVDTGPVHTQMQIQHRSRAPGPPCHSYSYITSREAEPAAKRVYLGPQFNRLRPNAVHR